MLPFFRRRQVRIALTVFFMELIRALAVFAEPPNEDLTNIAKALGFENIPTDDEYTETFLFNLYPYASVYLGAEGMLGGEARDRIAGFWRALNLTPPNEPDHLSTLLGLYENLCEKADGARGRWSEGEKKHKSQKSKVKGQFHHARKVLFWEHIASWLPVYLYKMKSITSPFYLLWSELLEKVLIEEANKLGQPETISQHLIADFTLQNPNEHGFEMFLSSLLSPASSGMILTKSDLGRAGQELNLSLRIAERKFVLQTLFSQDPQNVLKWLSNEANSWLQWHQSQTKIYGETALIWVKKTESSLRLLNELETNL